MLYRVSSIEYRVSTEEDACHGVVAPRDSEAPRLRTFTTVTMLLCIPCNNPLLFDKKKA